MMDEVLGPCYEVAAPYMDDILVFSLTWKEHLRDVEKVLLLLRLHKLTAKPAECEWGMKYVEYLGHIIGSGIVVIPEMRVTAMSEYKRPITKKDVRVF